MVSIQRDRLGKSKVAAVVVVSLTTLSWSHLISDSDQELSLVSEQAIPLLSSRTFSQASASQENYPPIKSPDRNGFGGQAVQRSTEERQIRQLGPRSDWGSGWIDIGLVGAVKLQLDLSWADLSDTDLRWAHLLEPDLSGAFLIGTNLSWASLIDAKLDDVVLIHAQIQSANLGRVQMQRANLSWATLHSSSLVGSMMTEAVFYETDLRFTNLSFASLDDSDLTGADLRRALLV